MIKHLKALSLALALVCTTGVLALSAPQSSTSIGLQCGTWSMPWSFDVTVVGQADNVEEAVINFGEKLAQALRMQALEEGRACMPSTCTMFSSCSIDFTKTGMVPGIPSILFDPVTRIWTVTGRVTGTTNTVCDDCFF